MDAFGVRSADLSTLGRLVASPETAKALFAFIDRHARLSQAPIARPPSQDLLKGFRLKTQKLIDHAADRRLSGLLDYTADVQRIQTAVATGKRMTSTQAKSLLTHVGCILSEPQLIARHFPMDADMIDILVIDEASQVSIAESISLMLRARQTVVFGDDLQYGAVGALNVSQRYATHYFKDILKNYAKDRREAISETEAERIATEANQDEEEEASCTLFAVEPGTREWLKTFSVRTSTLAFAKALCNYSESLTVHFRSVPEIISYSNMFFYKPSQIELIPNRIRTKPIGDVLRFVKVESQGFAGRNVNVDEIEAIGNDVKAVIDAGYKGTIGVICSFKEQTARMEAFFRRELTIYPELVRHHKLAIWFVGDVQGEERDLVYYSFVQDNRIANADLKTIYPIIGGAADDIRRLKMQRLNVGFSRAKDIMVFVHSMPIGDYADTRLGDALRHYEAQRNSAHDHYVTDEAIFGSPAEKALYALIVQTPFFQAHKDRLRLIAQFEIGKYIRAEYHRCIPAYRVDFLLTLSDGGKEKSLIIEYDGLEFHFRNPETVTRDTIDQEYLEYDAQRQLELESYGYRFLRITKFSLLLQGDKHCPVDMLDAMLQEAFGAR
jgi:very-short-patch-repair endonuclease